MYRVELVTRGKVLAGGIARKGYLAAHKRSIAALDAEDGTTARRAALRTKSVSKTVLVKLSRMARYSHDPHVG